LKLEHGAATDVGKRREKNEDSWLIVDDDSLFIVADGMGGHKSGEVASRLAVESIRGFFRQTAPDQDNTWPHVAMDPETNLDDYNSCRLVSAIQFAHRRIAYEVQQQPDLAGMGTTVVCVLFADEKAYIAHVGDSRCYCLSGKHLWQVTSDHTLANHMRERFEELNEEQEQRLAGLQHVVVRALGGNDTSDARVDLAVLHPGSGDVFMLCTDGLTGELDDVAIKESLEKSDSPQQICDHLVTAAVDNGGRDNVTVCSIRVLEVDESLRAQISGEATMEALQNMDDTGEETIESEDLIDAEDFKE
jgi:PPM family protein phosphatase